MFLSSAACAQNVWVQKANVGSTGRSSAVGFSIDGYGYIGTGYNINFGTQSDFWKYDTLLNAWTQVASISGARFNSFCFVIDSIGFVGGGDGGPGMGGLSNMQKYSPATNTWTAVANYPSAINSGIGMSINGIGYVYDFTAMNNFYRYDPGINNWSAETNYPGLEADAASIFAIGDNGYIMSGWLGGGVYRTVYMYSSVTHSWTQKNSFPVSGRWDASAFTINGRGYYGFGIDSANNYHNDFWEYDPGLDSWQQIADFPGNQRYQGVSFSIGNFGYAGTGLVMLDFYKYYPTTTSIEFPTKDFFAIKVNDHAIIVTLDTPMQYQLYALTGKRIAAGKAISKITIPKLQQGIYLLQINNLKVIKVLVD